MTEQETRDPWSKYFAERQKRERTAFQIRLERLEDNQRRLTKAMKDTQISLIVASVSIAFLAAAVMLS